MKIKSSHIIGAVFVVGLLIYLFSKKTVSGTVIADESDATITYKPGSFTGTTTYGTELQSS